MRARMLVAIAVVVITTFRSCSGESKSLTVKITVDYSPPLSFSLTHPSYRAASALTLTCEVENIDPTASLSYNWDSTCGSGCFVHSKYKMKSVSTPYLHSYDSGVHTCTVFDDMDCVGNASITINVVGAGVYTQSGHRVLPNNDLITTIPGRNTISSFHCLSGSSSPNVGNLIGPQGTDITLSSSDPFVVERGGSGDPGTLYVRGRRALRGEETGIYTYRTPDENGSFVEFYFGIYYPNHPGPMISSMDYSLTDGGLTVSCYSHNSPPTQVIWEKDGERIYLNDTSYSFTQTLLNRTTSSYSNVLSITASIEDVIGEYSCTVVNSLGTSNRLTKTIEAVEVSGHETPVLVGLSRNVTCTANLNVTRMEWLLAGVMQPSVEENDNGEQSLILHLNPTDTQLNGALFTCRITTASGRSVEETIIADIRVLTHEVKIAGPLNPLQAGSKYALTCTVTSDLPSSVIWVDSASNEVNGSDPSIIPGQPIRNGNTTTLVLNFDPVKTSHGGVYSCESVIPNPYFYKNATHQLVVQITSHSSASITRSPSSSTVYTSDPLNLTCVTTLTNSRAVDIPVRVIHQWRKAGVLVYSGNNSMVISGVTVSGLTYSSTLSIAYLRTSHSGTYSCSSTVAARQSSPYVQSSPAQILSSSFSTAIATTIVINYTSPDTNSVYTPPNYRAASGPVTLSCLATGTTGHVTYRWSSTCSSCFARSSSAQNITKNFVTSRDAGTHTCTVSNDGNTGTANTVMNIVGAGIYVDYAVRSSTGTSYGVQGAQPANGYAVVDTGRPNRNSNTRFNMFCCSNSTYQSGAIILSNSVTRTSDYNYVRISRQNGALTGCVQFYYSYYYGSSFSSSRVYNGIHTCQIPDSAGNNLYVNIGIYYQGYSATPSIRNLQYTKLSNGSIQFFCQARYSFTGIQWYKDERPLVINDTTAMSVTVTSRTGSNNYESTLRVCNSPGHVVGSYKCQAESISSYGSRRSAHRTHIVRGLQASCPGGTVGSTVRCTCSSSDISYYSLRWYRGSTRLSSSGSLTFQVSTDDEGAMYTCTMSTSCGIQHKYINITTTVPSNWASVEVSNSSGQNALENTNYTLVCAVRVIAGMNLPVRMEWVGPDGSVVGSEVNRTVGEVETRDTLSTLTLSFHPVFSSDGGSYMCRAAITVPWMTTQPPQISGAMNLIVISQALFQLKIYPVPQCLNLDVERARDLTISIKRAIEEAVKKGCGCPFSSSAIYSDHFSCETVGEVLSPHLTYRAIVNGSSDLLPASRALQHIQDWVDAEGAFDYYFFRLKLISTRQCKLKIKSLNEKGC